jgi:hypothetical protein
MVGEGGNFPPLWPWLSVLPPGDYQADADSHNERPADEPAFFGKNAGHQQQPRDRDDCADYRSHELPSLLDCTGVGHGGIVAARNCPLAAPWGDLVQ